MAGRIGVGIALTLAASAAGCAIPEYHRPAGFSGSYFRHLFGDAPQAAVGMPLSMPPQGPAAEPAAESPANGARLSESDDVEADSNSRESSADAESAPAAAAP